MTETTETNITGMMLSAVVLTLTPAIVAAQGPTSATHVPNAEIMTVFESLNGSVDKQVRVVDIGSDINVAVGILRRAGVHTEGDEVGAILHHQVTEVYYVVSGSGVLVTGGDATGDQEFPPESAAVTELIGPSGRRSIRNGQTQVIAAGDVVVIPAGVPHGFRHIEDSITYLSIRVDPDQVLPAGYANPALAR